MKSRIKLLLIILITTQFAFSQGNVFNVTGTVKDEQGYTIEGARISINDTNLIAYSNSYGQFHFSSLKPREYVLHIKALGYLSQSKSILIDGSPIKFSVSLKEKALELDEVIIDKKEEATQEEIIEQTGFNVDYVETKELKTQSIDINKVLDRSPGIRVRKSGGMGSDFEYSLDGMSGNAIRFFLDGIPMDYYGTSYSINNLPISLIKEITIYKGVVPIELGTDALGGVVNLVTDKKPHSYLEGSYSYGSFNTHQIAIHGQWIDTTSRFTTRLSTFYNYSDNNYKVWGPGVHYADPETYKVIEYTKENPAERFNDDFRTANIKLDIGFTEKKWADQFFITLLTTDQKRGIQTGQNMARVYGKVRYNEQLIMPSIVYKKGDFLTEGLDVNLFSGYSITNGTLVDTSSAKYDWAGDILAYTPGGEIVTRDNQSEFTLIDRTWISRFNSSYKLSDHYKIGFNYLGTITNRIGKDPYSPKYRIPYLEPQAITSHFAGLSLEALKFREKLRANVFAKFYHFDATINEYSYVGQELGYVLFSHENSETNWGAGFASSYKFLPKVLFKISLEQAARMPTATEALGNGVGIENNPKIKPVTSFNMNLGATFGNYSLGKKHTIKLSTNAFLRDTKNKLLFTVTDGFGNGEYRNVEKTLGKGIELEFVYGYGEWFKLTANGTYLDIRNNLEYEPDGRKNIVYWDRLRNTPYLMSNIGFQIHLDHVIQKKSKVMFYGQSSYVHEFFLNWPSLGNQTGKRTIPSQLVFDTGISYTIPSKKLSLSMDVSNLLNKQLFDNYLLQKPGRAISFKLNYQIKTK